MDSLFAIRLMASSIDTEGSLVPNMAQRMRHAKRLYDSERYDPCIAECRALLSYDEISPYYEMHARILIVCALEDWDKADVSLELTCKVAMEIIIKCYQVTPLHVTIHPLYPTLG
jgi:hypothetical protein